MKRQRTDSYLGTYQVPSTVEEYYNSYQPEASLWNLPVQRVLRHYSQRIEHQFQGTVEFGNRLTCSIPQAVSPLVTVCYIFYQLPSLPIDYRYVDRVATAATKVVEWDLSGSLIDSHTGQWLDIFAERFDELGQRDNYDIMIGHVPGWSAQQDGKNLGYDPNDPHRTWSFYLPLRFSFNRSNYDALRMIAMKNTVCRINLETNTLGYIVTRVDGTPVNEAQLRADIQAAGNVPQLQASLVATHVFLTAEESSLYESLDEAITVDTVQFLGRTPVVLTDQTPIRRIKPDLNFSNLIKQIFVVFVDDADVAAKNYFSYKDFATSIKVILGGNEATKLYDPNIYKLLDGYERGRVVNPARNIYSIGFALFPDNRQPSGVYNFAQIQANLEIEINLPARTTGNISIYGIRMDNLQYNKGTLKKTYGN